MLLERDHELQRLTDLLTEVGTSGGKIVLIRGEAGIGKSALVSQFAESCGDGATFLVGSCDDLSTPEPLGPIRDIARTETDLARPLGTGDRSGVTEALLELLSRRLRTTVLTFEDIHWADEATLDVIKYVGRRIAQTSGMLVLTYRDGEVDLDHPLRHVIGELQPGDLERIHLQPLSKSAVASMVGGDDLDVDQVYELTTGNPLFVSELLNSAPEQIPSSVQDSVLARASKLSPRARALLELVAVVPGKTEQPLLTEMLHPSSEELAECIRQGLLQVETTNLSFRHELARQAVELALDPATRQQLNQQVLSAIGPEGNPSRLVHHAMQAGDIPALVRYAPVAARSALNLGSLREALAHFRSLEPYLDRLPEPERARIIDDWAHSEFYLDNPDSLGILEQAISLYRSTDDDEALARALTFAVRVYEVSGLPESAERCADEALAILETKPPGPDLAFALSQRGWLAMMRSEGEAAVEYADRALEMASAVGDELTMVYSLNTKGVIRYLEGHPDGPVMLEEARSRAEKGGYRFEEIRALLNSASSAIVRMDLPLAADMAQRAAAAGSRYEIEVLEFYAQAQYANVLLLRGEWAMAEDLGRELLASHPHSRLLAGFVLARLQIRQGRPKARDTLEALWSEAEAAGELQNLVPLAGVVAEFIWLTGEDQFESRARLREVMEEATDRNDPWSRGDLAWWLLQIGELSSAPEGMPLPYVLTLDGKVRAAADEWDRLGLPYEKAVALTQSDREGKLEALEILETLGANPVAAKVRQLMRAEGITVPRGRARATRSHSAGLTARQVEVLHLLDVGLSNPEIADRLFVSPRTVENHVAAIMAKLDSSSREEAVTRARDQGLVPTG